jgi:ATP-binding cassette subfamily B protein
MLLLIGISNLFVIFIGGKRYIDGEIESVGLILEFIIYVNMLTWPVAIVGWLSSIIQRAEASQKRINEFLSVVPAITDAEDAIVKDLQGEIVFDKVSFTYPDTGIKALDQVSFSISKGETLTILGKTGAGKSSIIDLISRMYDVDSGVITIDGIPIQDISLESLREAMGVVPQDAFLFSNSIEFNIAFGSKEASREEVEEAAKKAVVHKNIIEFNKGYETVLGERGITLSGGQKQRVSIARALIKNPQIYLFDDCLSAVDTETEELILKNIKESSKDKTTLIVSHRVSSAINADKIIVLSEGAIEQQGSHNELIAKEGYYKSLYEAQTSSKEN